MLGKNGILANWTKNAIAAFTGQLIGLNMLDAGVAVWKQASAAGLASLIVSVYNWASGDSAPGKLKKG